MAAEQHVENEENPAKNLKRKRDPSVLDNFTKLTNRQEKVRVKAGVNLLRHLWENENVRKSEVITHVTGDTFCSVLGR